MWSLLQSCPKPPLANLKFETFTARLDGVYKVKYVYVKLTATAIMFLLVIITALSLTDNNATTPKNRDSG